MKYLRYMTILILKVIGKIIGIPMFYILLPLRGYARHTVYNYVLKNGIYLPRLNDRQWMFSSFTMEYYPLNKSKKDFMLKNQAYIKYKDVSKIEYYLALFIWVWFDDDSNFDTHDGTPDDETIEKPFGTTWDLGYLRDDYPVIDLKKTFYWIQRNAFYNFNYMFEEIREDNVNNFYTKFSKLGWHFGFIPYSNSVRKGRMVWFTEDYDKLDK